MDAPEAYGDVVQGRQQGEPPCALPCLFLLPLVSDEVRAHVADVLTAKNRSGPTDCWARGRYVGMLVGVHTNGALARAATA